MKILVTGGAGFIGTNLIRRLLAEGNSVICLDNFYSSSKNNIKQFEGLNEFKIVEGDVRKPFEINDKIDQIYHLACPASPPRYQKDPRFTLDTSVFGIINALEFAKKNKAKILFSSTSEIYGNPLEHPQTEKYFGNVNTVGERSCYDEGKRVAESYCYVYKKMGVDVRVIRIFNTYGTFMDPEDGRVVSNLINQALSDEEITIFGSGEQTRSFCYIDDLVDGMMRFINLKNAEFGPINLGNPGEFTMLELAKMILEKVPESKSKIVFRKLPSDDPAKRRPDISKAKELLNWEPKVGLDEGLGRTIDYFKNIRSN